MKYYELTKDAEKDLRAVARYTLNKWGKEVIVDPESYDEMVQNQELLQTLKNIAIANEQHENGQSKPAKQVFQELKDELKAKDQI